MGMYFLFDNITLSKVVSHQRAIAYMPVHGLECGVMLTVNESFIPKIQLDSICSIEFEYMLFVVGKDGTKHGYLTVTPHF